jgi:APA family basic amino acid/polyamine antiporter
LYGWTLFLVIQTGTIAAVAVGFAKFLGVLTPWIAAERTIFQFGTLSFSTQQAVAIALIALLTWSNSRGIREGKLVQNVFTSAKVAALAVLIVLGVFVARNEQAVSANFNNFWGETPFSLGFAMVVGGAMVGPLFSSDAWNNVTFTASEVKNPRRTLPLSLLGGTGLVMALYFLTNLAYLSLLPLTGSPSGESVVTRGIQYAAEDRVATAAAYMVFGPSAASIMAVAIMISTFGCLNGLILAGPRLYYAMAQDRLFFATTGLLNAAGVPAGGLWLQMVWAAVLALSGTYGNLLDYVVFAALLFYVLTVVGLLILRKTRPDVERPYRAFGYPWLPAAYVLVAATLMVDLLFVKPTYTWPGLLIVLTGVPVYFFWQRR